MRRSELFDIEYTNHILWLMSQLPVTVRYQEIDNENCNFQNVDLNDYYILELVYRLLSIVSDSVFDICGCVESGEDINNYYRPTLDLSQKYKNKTMLEYFETYKNAILDYEESSSCTYKNNAPIKTKDYIEKFQIDLIKAIKRQNKMLDLIEKRDIEPVERNTKQRMNY